MKELDLEPTLAVGLSLAEACSRAEGHLVNHLPPVICKTVVDAEAGARQLAEDRFVLSDTVYDIRPGAAISDASALHVVIGELGGNWSVESFEGCTVGVQGHGRYTSAVISADPRLSAVVETIGQSVQVYLADGYRRLQANVMRELLEADHRISLKLYAEIRSVFDEGVASRISLYALIEEREAIYLLDPPAILKALQRASSRRPSVAASPLTLTALLVRDSVRADETVALGALDRESPVAVRLADQYYSNSPQFNLAEISIYGDTAHVQPIVRDGKVRLIAGYPTELRDIAEPGLARLEKRLSEITRDYERAVVKLVESKHRSSPTSRRWDKYIFGLAGRVLK
ncbi:MAG TPA: hypothetical protein VFX85_03020 [Solirubrobacterales bacterium]|nr:hypothetical protein [Solirubrobacterales bacterium]